MRTSYNARMWQSSFRHEGRHTYPQSASRAREAVTHGRSSPSSRFTALPVRASRAAVTHILLGAGVSAESGVPTFRGAGGFWRTWQAQDLATPGAFRKNPSLVWEFYHYRREVMRTKDPNPAHIAIAEAETHLEAEGRRLVVITQNIDELHHRAGSKKVWELHGSLFRTLCTQCGDIRPNKDSPICTALDGKGAPDPSAEDARIPESELPRCPSCSGLIRPHVVWFGEGLDGDVLHEAGHIDYKRCLIFIFAFIFYQKLYHYRNISSIGVLTVGFNSEAKG
ncbi:unnamed protein product, partial [Meganyctiphanes norvegica]